MQPKETPMQTWQLPEYEVHALRGRRTKYCLCVFVINEGQRIRRQLARMKPWSSKVDVILADGGSSDGSLELGYLGEQGVRALLVKKSPGRLSTQMRMALGYALKERYEGVIVMDGNDKDHPEAIDRFLAALEAGVDHVQGSRFVPGGQAIRTPWARLWGIRLLHAPLISLAAWFRYTDTTNGFRAYSSRLLRDPRVAPFREVFSRYELHYYLAIRAPRIGYKAAEVPVTREYPREGKTPTKISGLRGNLLVLRTLLAACLGRYNPPRKTASAAQKPVGKHRRAA
jgi:glycosyltransferase involved in cell wall biosynthesis